MSNYLNENLILDPQYRTLCVTLAANSNPSRKRGSVICRKATDDGTLDIYGVANYTVPFGILLEDVEASATATPTVQLLVSGEVSAVACGKQASNAFANLTVSPYATDPDGGDNILIRQLREVGIIAK